MDSPVASQGDQLLDRVPALVAGGQILLDALFVPVVDVRVFEQFPSRGIHVVDLGLVQLQLLDERLKKTIIVRKQGGEKYSEVSRARPRGDKELIFIISGRSFNSPEGQCTHSSRINYSIIIPIIP